MENSEKVVKIVEMYAGLSSTYRYREMVRVVVCSPNQCAPGCNCKDVDIVWESDPYTPNASAIGKSHRAIAIRRAIEIAKTTAAERNLRRWE